MDTGSFSLDNMLALAQTYVVPLAIDVLLAIVVFLVGRWAARMVTRLAVRMLRRAKTDESLVKFVTDVLYGLLLVIVVIAALERVGIKTTAAIAVIGAAGLAVGLALQGSLANFAAGVLIIIFKPYKIGDTVTAAGKLGTVESIHMFTTVLHTSDMVRVIIPNGAITATSIENFSALGTRRLELVFGIAGDAVGQAQADLERLVTDDPRVLRDPAPEVALIELGEKTATFAVHASLKAEDLGPVRADIMQRIKKDFDARLVTAKAA